MANKSASRLLADVVDVVAIILVVFHLLKPPSRKFDEKKEPGDRAVKPRSRTNDVEKGRKPSPQPLSLATYTPHATRQIY